jgi:serine protease Do
MKYPIVPCLLPLLLLATAAQAAEPEVKQEVIIRRHAAPLGEPPEFDSRPGEPMEMEKVAYLGVETTPVDPTVAAQLGLARGTGIVVRRVADGSPAAGVLQAHDVLTRLDDQILVNMGQLTVLVRNHKVGDEVKLTYVRGGKELSAKVKLGEREIPKAMVWNDGGFGAPMQVFGHAMGGGPSTALALPAMPLPPEAGDVMRIIGRDRNTWFAHPRVHVLRRSGGAGSTILDLPAGNFVFSDDQGSVEVNAAQGKRELTVKDKEGKVTFQGPINTPEEHEKLPPEVKKRLDEIGGAEFGSERREIKLGTEVLDPATKVQFRLKRHGGEAVAQEPGMRTL